MLVEFIMMTLSITVGILLASVLAFMLMFNKKVLKWYMKKVNNISKQLVDEMFDENEDEL